MNKFHVYSERSSDQVCSYNITLWKIICISEGEIYVLHNKIK